MSQRLGVLFLNSPERPGADTWVQSLLMRHLDRSRFEVHAAVTPGSEEAPSPSLAVLRTIPDLDIRGTDFGPSFTGMSKAEKVLALRGFVPMLGSLAGLVGHIRRRGIRVIHASDRPRDAIPCVLLARASGAKAVVHVHVKCDQWMSGPVRLAMKTADALIAISRHVEQSFDTFAIAPHRRHVVLNSIDPSAWDPTIDGRPVREEFGFPLGAPVLISVSRLFHWKGQIDLLKAFAIARRTYPEARLFIVGEEDRTAGADRPNYLAELQALARELGVSSHVAFTGKRSDVARMLAASDIFSMPSFEEPFGLVYAEAMAMKKPVVALDNGGTPEVVDHGQSGLLAPPGDLEALAANMVKLIGDPALRARMGAHGRQQVEARFAPRRMAEDFARVYTDLTR